MKRILILLATAAAAVGLTLTFAVPGGADPVHPHAQLSTSFDQYLGGTVEFDQVDSISFASFDEATDGLTLEAPGLWLLIAAPQVGSIQNPSANGGSANFWLAADGVQIPNSNVTWQANGRGGDVIVSQGVGSFEADTVITVEWSTTGPALEAITTPGEPLTPSIIFTAVLIG
jgi:hypothetical protein